MSFALPCALLVRCTLLFLLALSITATPEELAPERIKIFGDSSNAPVSVDWRASGAVTAVKNAGSCTGGSWAFATAAAVEAVNKISTGTLVDLSVQQLLDCETSYGNQGCKSGFPQYAFMYLKDAGGLTTAAEYPFTGTNQTCHRKNRYVVDIDDYDNLYPSSDDTEIVSIVAKQPVTALVDGTADAFKNYTGGVYKGPCSDSTVSLSVLIVGYGSQNGEDYWIIKNSWGTSWGENGYMRLQRGNHGLPLGRCAVNSFIWYPLKAVSPSPPPPPPSPPPPPPSPPPPSPPPPSPPRPRPSPSPPPPPRPSPSPSPPRPRPSPPRPRPCRMPCPFFSTPCCRGRFPICCYNALRCTASGCKR